MTPEEIAKLFQDMEEDLFKSMARNLQAHEDWEEEEGFQWEQWQAMQIKGLRKYREEIQDIVNHTYGKARPEMERLLREAYHQAGRDSMEWLRRHSTHSYAQKFFGVPPQMTTLLNDVLNDVEQTRYGAINRMNTGYTNALQKADIMVQSGSYTYRQAVDMATKDFVSAGLNCVEYKNGARVGIDSYVEMVLRTSAYESARIAEGNKRDEWGEHLVISNVIGTTCPHCARWQGKVLVDDVYSNGKPDGKHQLLSTAKEDKFLHPNCRHKPRTYIEGITAIPRQPDAVKNKEQYNAEQKQRYYERNIRKYKRLRDCAVDPVNKEKYTGRIKEWEKALNNHIEQNPYLKKDAWRTTSRGVNGNRGNNRLSNNTSSEYGRLSNRKKEEEKNSILSDALRKSVHFGTPNVDLDYIKSSDFRRKFSGISDNNDVNDVLRRFASGALTKNNGTYTESMLAYNVDTMKDIIRKTGKKDALGIDLTEGEVLTIKNTNGDKIGIHTHPTNIPPTGSDFVASAYRGYKYGVVVTHDGRVYKYTPPTSVVTPRYIDAVIDKNIHGVYNDEEVYRRYTEALNKLSKECGLTWEEMT